MNYLAHGYRFLERPWFLAGTAVPDWLRVVRRRVPLQWTEPENETCSDTRDLAAGLVRHLADDAAFHAGPAFALVSRDITLDIRRRFPRKPRLRSHFLGHVLTELLLDAHLMESRPRLADSYYAALAGIDPEAVERVVNRWLPRPTNRLVPLIEGFLRHEFLRDYLEDARLVYRLRQVAARAGLPDPPPGFEDCLPPARDLVRRHAAELLASAGGTESDPSPARTDPIRGARAT